MKLPFSHLMPPFHTEPKPADDPDEAKRNAEAAERCILWNLGWFADPVYFGDYVSARNMFLGLQRAK